MVLSLIRFGLRYLLAHPDKAALVLDDIEKVVTAIIAHHSK